MPRYSHVDVTLSPADGSWCIIGKVTRAMKRGGIHYPEIQKFQVRAQFESDCDGLLLLCREWVNVKMGNLPDDDDCGDMLSEEVQPYD